MKLQEAITLQDAAKLLGCSFVGDPMHLITGLNEIHMVEAGDLTFVDVEKYYKKALSSAATTILINKSVEPPQGKALLVYDEPFTGYNFLAEHFNPSYPLDTVGRPILGENVRMGRNVWCGNDVEIGDNTEIGHNVCIGSHVRIGANCRIHANVSIYDRVYIGNHVTINSGTTLGSEAFYFKSRAESKEKMLSKGRTIIHDHVDIGANCTIDAGVSGDTVIGEWTKLDNLIQIGHDTQIGKRCIFAAQVGIAGVCVIGDDVVLWGKVGITKEVVVGSKASVLSNSIVISSIEGNQVYYGFAATHRQRALREMAALRKLPELLRKLDMKEADEG